MTWRASRLVIFVPTTIARESSMLRLSLGLKCFCWSSGVRFWGQGDRRESSRLQEPMSSSRRPPARRGCLCARAFGLQEHSHLSGPRKLQIFIARWVLRGRLGETLLLFILDKSGAQHVQLQFESIEISQTFPIVWQSDQHRYPFIPNGSWLVSRCQCCNCFLH